MPESSENYLLSNRRWRAILYDYDTLSTYGQGDCIVCLTEFERAWLQSNVQYMAWMNRWVNYTGTPEDLKVMADELEYKLMSCQTFYPNQLQFLYNQNIQALLDAMEDRYNSGGIPELNPDTPTDFFNGDNSQERLDALCTAASLYVFSYAQNWLQEASVLLGLQVLVDFAINLITVGYLIPLKWNLGLSFVDIPTFDAFQDEDALNDVICCMRDALIGEAIAQSAFEDSLDSCSFTPGSNQELIQLAMQPDLEQFQNFLTFLNSLGDAFVFASNGFVVCDCIVCPPYVPITFDNPANYTITQGSVDGGFGNPAPSLATTDFGSFLQSIVNSLCIEAVLMTGLNVDVYFGGSTFFEYEILDQDDNSLTGGLIGVTIPSATWTNINLPITVPTTVTAFRLRLFRNTVSPVTLFVDNINIY